MSKNKGMNNWIRITLLLILCTSMLFGCSPAWEFSVETPNGDQININQDNLEGLEKFSETHDGEDLIPLERIFADAGYSIIGQIQITQQEGKKLSYEWAPIAEDAWLGFDGKLQIQGQEFSPKVIQVFPDEVLNNVQASITDIAPTAASALGLGKMGSATGQALIDTQAEHVFLIFLDAFGYVRYQQALEEGLIPYIGSLETPLVALTVYPPATVPSSASVLTGATSDVHGVDQRKPRKTEAETLFDIAAKAGLDVQAVEGDALSFELRNAEFKLSGDRDNDGSTNDDVFKNAREVLLNGMPDIFWVHFHGIDDAGHTYGPGAPEEKAEIKQVDAAVEELIELAPENTLVIIFADHGMHTVYNSEKKGNHGHLIPEDMLIPIFILEK
jgi:hypothetical protein